MAKVKKAQTGSIRSDLAKKKLENSSNPLLTYSGRPSRRTIFGSKKYPTSMSVDTTGYAAGAKTAFPASSELMMNKPGKKNPKMYGYMRREGVQKALSSQKKKTGGSVKAQRGLKVCGPGGCRQTRGMVGYGGGERKGLLKRIFAPNRKTGGSTKKK